LVVVPPFEVVVVVTTLLIDGYWTEKRFPARVRTLISTLPPE
jgi:hypothetical protein